MSEEKKENVKVENIFNVMDDYILVRSRGEIEEKKILIPQTGAYSQRRSWIDEDNTAMAIADNIKDKVKINDKLFLVPHCKLRRMDEITKIIEDKTGVKSVVDIMDKEGKSVIGKQELEKYFIIKLEDVMCLIN